MSKVPGQGTGVASWRALLHVATVPASFTFRLLSSMLEKVLLRSLLVLGTVSVLNGKTLEVNWTSQGVEAYRDPR